MRRLLASALVLAAAMPAAAQDRTVITQPVPGQDSYINAPIERDSNGVVKAQYFKAEDLTPAQLDALLAEADRVRSYQQSNGVFIRPDTAPSAPVAVPSAPATSYASGAYEIELYEAPAIVAAPVTARIHTVAKGDTLYNISKRYGVSVDEVQAANSLSGSAIGLGQVLTIPSGPQASSLNTAAPATALAQAPSTITQRIVQPVPVTQPVQSVTARADTTYAVLPKDTLYAISRRSCINVPALIAANGLTDANTLKPGQKLRIPAGHCLAN